MQEYKREKVSLETRLKEMLKTTTYHDDHLRVIDAWYNQVCTSTTFLLLVSVPNCLRKLIDEVKVVLGMPKEDKGASDLTPLISVDSD